MKSSSKRPSARIIFITGTDTGVGKTLLTGLLLHHLRTGGHHALAMKPFCSGGTADVDFLSAVQDGELTLKEINPFYFSEPVAPLVSARKHKKRIALAEVLDSINKVAARCETLFIEGSGGLLVPLGENFSVATLIKTLKCEVIVVARNRLGVLNHTLLTVDALRHMGCRQIKIVLMGEKCPDVSARTNSMILSELISQSLLNTEMFSIGFIGENATSLKAVKDSLKKNKKMLASISK